MKALVLGGGGFLGSHLVDELLNRNHDVRVLDRAAEQHRATPRAVDYRLGDFADPAVTAEALQDVDTVYHLASTTVPSTSNLDPTADIRANLIPGVRLLEQLVRLDVPRIVFLSSGGTIYGNPKNVPVAVEHPANPRCSYGVVKIATEQYLHMFQELYGLSPTILRASNPYGPRQGRLGVQGAIATFLDRLIKTEPIRIWGDGSVVRDYLYVTDLTGSVHSPGSQPTKGPTTPAAGSDTFSMLFCRPLKTSLANTRNRTSRHRVHWTLTRSCSTSASLSPCLAGGPRSAFMMASPATGPGYSRAGRYGGAPGSRERDHGVATCWCPIHIPLLARLTRTAECP